MKTKPRETLALNLRLLMDASGLNQEEVSKRAGVSQKQISNMLDPSGPNPTLSKIEAVAAVWGLTEWQLLIPNLPSDPAAGRAIGTLLTKYLATTEHGRDAINSVAGLTPDRTGNDK